MVSKNLLSSVLLGAALFIGGDANVFAAGHGGGGHGGGGHGGGGYGHGGYGGYGYGRGYGYGYGGFGYGLGFYGGYYGDYYGGYYPYATYPYAAPVYAPPVYAPPVAAVVPLAAAKTSYYYAPAPVAYSGNASGTAVAKIHVALPDPSATVLFDGHKTTTTGTDRFYETPPLTPGGTYNYTLRVTWTQDGQTLTQDRTVTASPGQTTDVVFTRSANEAPAAVSAK